MKKSVYLNYGGVAPLGASTILEMVKFLAHFYFRGPRSALLKYEGLIPLLAQEVAKLINCDPDEVTYLKNTSEGIIIAAESLPLVPGDEVLVMRLEYPANLIPWMKKKYDGIQVRVIDGPDTRTAFNTLIDSINDRTKAIAISWVQFYDGYIIDLEKLSAICKSKGIYLVLDAVQIVGTRTVDLKRFHADILMCGGHKHIMSVIGSGFLYINKNTLPRLKVFKAGIRSVKSFNSDGFILKETTGRLEDGTPNLMGIAALYHRIKKINEMGVDFIQRKSLERLTYYKDALRKNNIEFYDYEFQGNLISVPVKNAKGFIAFLEKNRLFARVIEGKIVRISFSYKSSKKDVHRFIELHQEFHNQDQSLG
jgi:cysteine desulfurase/selenocysteine lyase